MNEILCPNCDKLFKQKKNLYAHLRSTHGINPELTGSLLCPVENCEVRRHKYEGLRKHLSISHTVKCEKEVIQFKSWEEFLKWKQVTESTENNAYVLSTGAVTLATQERKTYFSCHRTKRSGTKTKQCHKMTRKSPGSKKILKTCPSTIEATVNETRVTVIRWKTHLGHFEDTSNIEFKLFKLFNSPSDYTLSSITENPNAKCNSLLVDNPCYKDVQESNANSPEKVHSNPVLINNCDSEISKSGSITCIDKNEIVENEISTTDYSGTTFTNASSNIDEAIIKDKIDMLCNYASTCQFTISQRCHFNKLLDECLDLCLHASSSKRSLSPS